MTDVETGKNTHFTNRELKLIKSGSGHFSSNESQKKEPNTVKTVYCVAWSLC